MSRAWQLARGGIRPPSVAPPEPEDRRRRRRAASPLAWVHPEMRAAILARLQAGESPAAVAGSLGLQLTTIEQIAKAG